MAKRGRRTGSDPSAQNGRQGRARRGQATRESRLEDIVERYTADLVAAVTREVRRSVADEVRDALTGSGGAGRGRSSAGRGGRRRILPCIAPGCSNPSKGPRFHYLCEKHRDARKADYEAWRKARREKQGAATTS
jgi:hypothetical protein